MAKLIATRSAQWPLLAEFTFNFDDTMADINGVTKSFGSTYTDAIVATAINLPEGCVVVGGEVVVETAGVGPTAYTVSLGDSVSATRYANAVDLKTAARTALTLTGYRTSENVRLTIASTVANASAGKATVRVLYVMPGRANEVVPN
jgi:hypothetical protein